ncbi:MAG: hypothetical protein EAX89_13175 [Candidatus Lokiarchaeota archaeon]|nr:hypothetical protein [Candidatus Lokiarchaeota archaeon]
MGTHSKYLKKVLNSRTKEYISITMLISFIVFISYIPKFGSIKGPVFQNKEVRYGDVWYIDFNNNNELDCYDFIITNPQSYIYILLPQNEGEEVVCFFLKGESVIPAMEPRSGCILYLDILHTYNLKLGTSMFLILIYISLSTTYFFIKRKHFQIINKLLY